MKTNTIKKAIATLTVITAIFTTGISAQAAGVSTDINIVNTVNSSKAYACILLEKPSNWKDGYSWQNGNITYTIDRIEQVENKYKGQICVIECYNTNTGVISFIEIYC